MNNKSAITATAFIISMMLALPAWSSASKEITYLDNKDFLAQAFSGETPAVKAVWLKESLKQEVAKILGHDYPALRVRYWIYNQRSAWVLEEVGKEKPITAGFVVEDNRLEMVRVLVFRESRGDEIHYPSFTKQFTGAALDKKQHLDRRIDGISGATLSVNAMRKLAAVALHLAGHVMKQQTKK